MNRAGLFCFFIVVSLFAVNLRADEFDNESKSTFQPVKSIIGITLGTPAFLHLNCATFAPNRFGARLAVGGLPGPNGAIYGFQLNAVKKIGERKKTIHELSLGVGYSMINWNAYWKDDDIWRYLGFFYGLTLDRFMLEVGLTGGTGSYPNPQLFAQIGIAFSKTRFR